ncbi:hypothetical protein BDV98DRAFT_179411 [Pterulicium gracile]|uniref:Uncharacterized protein n=1 Tax=Pterulicium gracile TaxID=1884261 RepID=A0A5C3QFX0_9AGAR|nr:hypothetical protein BDV98DRAFT_179411 [Pterula gracilis]
MFQFARQTLQLPSTSHVGTQTSIPQVANSQSSAPSTKPPKTAAEIAAENNKGTRKFSYRRSQTNVASKDLG